MTAVAPVKTVPVRVTVAPAPPLAGAKLVMVGAETAKARQVETKSRSKDLMGEVRKAGLRHRWGLQ